MSNWLTIIIVLLIVVILADGFRRSYAARQNRIGLSPSLGKRQKDLADDADAPDMLSGEFPNGGARVIGHRDTSTSSQQQKKAQEKLKAQARGSEKKLSSKDKREQRRREDAAQRAPEQANLNLERSVPILMESVKSESDFAVDDDRLSGERIEPTFSARREPSSLDDHEIEVLDQDYEDEELLEDEEIEGEYDEDFEEEYDEDFEGDDEEDYEDELEETAPQAQPEEVFIINVMSPKGKFFHGTDLLDATLKCGLRYGNMDIFHRYSNTKGEGVLLFSMANMVKPGTFDLDAMDEFDTPGVSLFMTLPIDADSMKSFELMVDTANVLAEALDGELKDEQRSAMTRQTIEHCRQRISDFERKKLFRRAK